MECLRFDRLTLSPEPASVNGFFQSILLQVRFEVVGVHHLAGHNLSLWGTIGFMNDQRDNSGNSENATASAGPFILAVAIVALILGGIFVSSWMSPAEENVSESDRISRLVADYVAAHNENDTKTLQGLTCANFDPETGPLADTEGDVEMQGLNETVVSGDRATVDVRLSGGGQDQRVEVWTLTRDGEGWDICT